MKIAFLEYYHKYRNTGDFNFVNAWFNLLGRRHKVDWVQLKDLDDYSIELGAKTVYQVDINSYDIVIMNDLYESRKMYIKDCAFQLFLDYIEKNVKTKKLYICHQRTFPKEQSQIDFYNMSLLVSKCDSVLTYVPEYFRTHKDVHKITFDLFYKPVEQKCELSSKGRPIDLKYFNNLVPWKNTKEFLDFAEVNKEQLSYIVMKGYYPETSLLDKENFNNIIRNDERVIWGEYYDSGIRQKGFIWLYPRIEDRTRVFLEYIDSKFSWQYTAPLDNSTMHEIPWGLEGAALESILYGCIPILPKKSENYDVLGKPLKSYDCCVFIDNEKDTEQIKEAISRYNVLFENCRKFSDKLLKDSNRYINSISKVLQEIIQQ
jgi:hypothetical protein